MVGASPFVPALVRAEPPRARSFRFRPPEDLFDFERGVEDQLTPVVVNPTAMDGTWPRKPLVQFLPFVRTAAGSATDDGEDARPPEDGADDDDLRERPPVDGVEEPRASVEDAPAVPLGDVDAPPPPPAFAEAAVVADDDEDMRLPVERSVLPFRLSHIHDDRGENFVVQYSSKVLCRDGRQRRTVWYRCRRAGIPVGSLEAAAGHELAGRQAWRHIERVLESDEGGGLVIPRHGEGQLLGRDSFRFHGDPEADHVFRVHPRRPDLRGHGMLHWEPAIDTWIEARRFCSHAQFVRRRADGVELWRCPGHDLTDSGIGPGDAVPAALHGKPLAEKVLVEVFSGDPHCGGGLFSHAWELAGGLAFRYDRSCDSSRNFLDDDAWWAAELMHPADQYIFLVPTSTLWMSETYAAQTRTVENPYGREWVEEVAEANRLVRTVVRLALRFAAAGAGVLLECPLACFFWDLTEVHSFLQLPDVECVRCDLCTFGASFGRACVLAGTCNKLTGLAGLCTHARPHPEGIGVGNRRTFPFPLQMTYRLTECLVAMLQEQGTLVEASTRAAAGDALDATGRRITTKGPAPGAAKARFRIAQLRAGLSTSTRADDMPDDDASVLRASEYDEPAPVVGARAVTGDFGDAPEAGLRGLSSFGFARDMLSRAQRADPEFGPVMRGLEVVSAASDRPTTEEALFKAVKNSLRHLGAGAARVAHRTVRSLGDYESRDGLLYRRVWDAREGVHSLRLVVPEGGERSYFYNGRRYRLGYRKTLLLLYHESPLCGAHSSAEDTASKIARSCWWATLQNDARSWVRSCAVCRLTKPQRGLNFEQRSNLHDRPFRVLYVDTIGPINPPDEGHSYVLHAQDAFTGYAWLRAVARDDAVTVATFLAEDVFLDVAGFPAVLRSDRGASYVNEIVAALTARLGIDHAMGASYRPQAQGYIEGAHQRVNNVLRAYCRNARWSRWIKVAQWALRATPRPDRGGYSPYELVTGLLPQGPLDRLWRRETAAPTSPQTYVDELQAAMRSVHAQVGHGIHADFQKRMKERASDPPPERLQPGDHVFLRLPPRAFVDRKGGVEASSSQQPVSARLLPYADPRLFRVSSVARNGQVHLENMSGESDLGFAQPVHASRLIPFELGQLESPVDPEAVLEIEILDRSGRALKGRVTHQTSTGLVRVEFPGSPGKDGLYDLACEEYRWLQ